MKNKGYAKFGGQIRCIMANVQVSYAKYDASEEEAGALWYAYILLEQKGRKSLKEKFWYILVWKVI